MILLYIVFIVYIAAVNLYAVMLLKAQRDESGESEKPVGDGKIILCAIMGGAIGIYAAMFAFRYRLKNLLFMILMPVLAVFNIYLFLVAFRSGYSFLIV